jgi:hypothetical protein
MVLYPSEISCWWWKNPRILNLSPCTQKMGSLLPWYTEFPVYLTSFSLSKKSTYLAYKISYRKISEINVKPKFCDFHFHALKNPNHICIVKELWSKSRFCWEMRIGSRKTLDIWGMFEHFTSEACEFPQPAFHSPKVHFHGSNAVIFPLCNNCMNNFQSIPRKRVLSRTQVTSLSPKSPQKSNSAKMASKISKLNLSPKNDSLGFCIWVNFLSENMKFWILDFVKVHYLKSAHTFAPSTEYGQK